MDFIRWIEGTRVSILASESSLAYFGLLVCHVWGMAMLVGGGLAVSLRLLGVAAAVPLDRFARFLPAVWAGGALAVISGVGLLIAYPAKTLTNWVFAMKMACLVAAILLFRHMVRRCFSADTEFPVARARALAVATLLLWVGVLISGKLLPYTYVMLASPDISPSGTAVPGY